jgi:3-carboxy-cis,cis-muconate cycloisomerase
MLEPAPSNSPFDNPLLGPLSGSAAMAQLFGAVNTLQRLLDVEAALSEAQAQLGLIPANAAKAIAAACQSHFYDPAAIGQAGAEAGNIAIPLVKALTAKVEGDAKRYVHWGATSQDILDTGLMLQIRDALSMIEQLLARFAKVLARQADAHRKTPMAGRTWLQHAAPITFGLKVAGWLDAITRHRMRLHETQKRVLALQFGGAAGTLASLGEKGPAVAQALAGTLALNLPDTPWHTHRDRIAETGALCGLIVGTLGKIARDISLMMQTEVGEAFEPAVAGRGGSSTMPHKRNPVLCAAILSVATSAPGLVATLMSAQVQEHERAAGTWAAEWCVLPDLMIQTAGALERSITLVDGMEINADHMRANLDMTMGLLMAEAAMMALAPHIGRNEAHHLIEEASKRALTDKRPLIDILGADKHVSQHLDAAALAHVFQPLGYLGAADTFINNVLATHHAWTERAPT